MDDSILYCVRKSVDEKKDMELSKARREALQYMKNCYTADEVFKKHGNSDVVEWNSKSDIQIILRPLKDKGDSKMPSERDELIQRFHSHKDRNRKTLSSDEHVLTAFDNWKEDRSSNKKGKHK